MSSSKRGRLYLTLVCLVGSLSIFHIAFRSVIKISNDCKHSKSVGVLGSFWHKVDYKKRSQFSSAKSKYLKRADMSKFTRTDYFGCQDFDKLPNTTQSREENHIGNRGISFINVKIHETIIPAVYKQASRTLNLVSEEYKYHMAIQEIEYLIKLHSLPGIPQLFGSCIRKCNVMYLVERVHGSTFCNDNGTTGYCSNASFLIEEVKRSPDPPQAALKLTYSAAKLFRLLEERRLFFEDISGVNLMFTPDFDVYLIDADSLVYYSRTRLLSQFKCESDNDCSGPSGNLWANTSLNVLIYENCLDLHGICENGRCRGVDVSLHVCGLAEWFICRMVKLFDNSKVRDQFESICNCMKEPHPENRCSFAEVTEKMEQLLSKKNVSLF